MNIRFIVPSYKRADNVVTNNYIEKNCVLAVHDFEAEEYKEHNKDSEIMILPDRTKGNMGAVRNYIKDNAEADVCVMMDDDVYTIGYYEQGKKKTIDQGGLIEKIKDWYYISIDLGIKLFGVNILDDAKAYREYTPFSFLAPILGPFSCIITKDNPLRYDERLGLNEDYDFFIQNIQKYKKVLRCNKFHYIADHLDKPGGCGAYRLLDNERKQAEIMQGKWGENIVRYDFSKGTNPKIYLPIKGV